jgi:hypothetical protein
MARQIILAIILSILLFCAGGYTAWRTIEPKVVYLRVPTYFVVPRYIFFTIKKTEIVKAYGNLRQFQSVEEFQEWFDSIIFWSAGDCDDWAIGFRDMARECGYDVETELTGKHTPEDHMLCKTIIGNKIIFIEPQNLTWWLECYRD